MPTVMMSLERNRIIPLLLCAVIGLSGCGGRETPVDIGNREQVFHRGMGSDPKGLDPHITTGVTAFNVISTLLEGLVSPHPEDVSTRPVPGVAESWDISADELEYTFHIREDARWSNGDPVTAGDFVFSFERILSPKLGSEYAYMLFCMKGAEDFNSGKITDFSQVGVKALDDHALRIALNSPTKYFLSLLMHHSWFPVHPPTILAHGPIDHRISEWTDPEHYVGNGPFTLKSWEPGKKLVVVKSRTYWDRDAVRLNEMRFYPIGDHTAEERAFRAGQLHVTEVVPLDRIQYYLEDQPRLIRVDPYLGTYYYLFNVTRPPMDNVNVRRALAMAIDREKLVRFVTKGGEEPAYHFTPPDTAGFTSRARLAHDVEEARRLLAEAGYPNGEGFPKVELLYNTSDAHLRIAEAIHQMWKTTLGIDVEMVNMEWKVYLAATRELKYDVARAGWIGDYIDPNTFLDMWITGRGNNRTGWSNEAYDGLLASAARELDEKKRHEYFQQAEQILAEQAPIMPIYFYRSKSLVQPSVRGWNPSLLDIHPAKHLYLEDSP